jgi:hypothetical protein
LLSPDSFEITKISRSDSKLTYNKVKVQFFISFFKMAAAEAYNNDNSKKDSILQTQPFAIISVEDTTGFVNEVKFYHKAVDRRTKLQSDKHYASINKGKDFMLVQDLTFGKFFRRVEEFK